MAAVSRSAMLHTCIGNTAEGVVNDLTCDVLVVKPQGFKSAVLRASLGVRLMAMAASAACVSSPGPAHLSHDGPTRQLPPRLRP